MIIVVVIVVDLVTNNEFNFLLPFTVLIKEFYRE